MLHNAKFQVSATTRPRPAPAAPSAQKRPGLRKSRANAALSTGGSASSTPKSSLPLSSSAAGRRWSGEAPAPAAYAYGSSTPSYGRRAPVVAVLVEMFGSTRRDFSPVRSVAAYPEPGWGAAYPGALQRVQRAGSPVRATSPHTARFQSAATRYGPALLRDTSPGPVRATSALSPSRAAVSVATMQAHSVTRPSSPRMESRMLSGRSQSPTPPAARFMQQWPPDVSAGFVAVPVGVMSAGGGPAGPAMSSIPVPFFGRPEVRPEAGPLLAMHPRRHQSPLHGQAPGVQLSGSALRAVSPWMRTPMFGAFVGGSMGSTAVPEPVGVAFDPRAESSRGGSLALSARPSASPSATPPSTQRFFAAAGVPVAALRSQMIPSSSSSDFALQQFKGAPPAALSLSRADRPRRSSPVVLPSMESGVLTPVMGRPPDLMAAIKALDRAAPRVGVEDKLRQWLFTIPMSNHDDRPWDDSQIMKIASFAQAVGIQHMGAEDIYKQYVVHQVEVADRMSESIGRL